MLTGKKRHHVTLLSWIYSYTSGVLTRLGEAPHPNLRGKNIPHIKSLRWNVLENTEWRAVRPNGIAPGLGDDAQSRRHNTSDLITIWKRMAAACRTPSVNQPDAVAMEKALVEFFLSWEWRWVDPARLCCPDLICAHMTAVGLCPQKLSKVQIQYQNLLVKKLWQKYHLLRLLLWPVYIEYVTPSACLPLSKRQASNSKRATDQIGCVWKEVMCFVCPGAEWRGASPWLVGCGAWQHTVTQKTYVCSLECNTRCLRLQPPRLVVCVKRCDSGVTLLSDKVWPSLPS